MSDDVTSSIGGGVQTAGSAVPPLVLGTQYVREMTFRVPGAPGIYALPSLKPHVTLALDVQVRQAEDRQPVYEVTLLMQCSATAQAPSPDAPSPPVAFVVELAYAGIFTLQHVAADVVEPVLFAECPRLLFPFARAVLADITREAGFPPVMLQPIDFLAFWQGKRSASAARGETLL
jgi:preprotein translocase subunit SecB